MRLEFHPQVTADISRIMDYYEDVAEPQLADEFYRELRSFFQRAAESPEAYEISEHDLRRVNLERFPYHFLFRIIRKPSADSGCSSSPETTIVRASSAMNSNTSAFLNY